MILVVGGRGAGKRSFVEHTLGYRPEQMSDCLSDGTPVLYHLQGIEPLPTWEQLCSFEVILCDEVGCGVVPMDRLQRERREAVGRLCCALAERAEQVYRVTCGLSMRLK